MVIVHRLGNRAIHSTNTLLYLTNEVFHTKLLPGTFVVLVDNLYVAGSGHPITRVDADGNIYQQWRLANGTHYEVLKNFLAEAELCRLVRPEPHVQLFVMKKVCPSKISAAILPYFVDLV